MCCGSVLLIALVGIVSGSAQTIIVCGNFIWNLKGLGLL